jgi:hypothetical protein
MVAHLFLQKLHPMTAVVAFIFKYRHFSILLACPKRTVIILAGKVRIGKK